MLISFKVQNLLSFDSEVCLSMVPAPKQKLHKHHEIPACKRSQYPLLRFAAVYGANASGKSNLVRAMHLVSQFVKNGTLHADEAIHCPRFKLAIDNLREPAKSEFIFRVDEKQFLYRIHFDDAQVVYEMLGVVQVGDEGTTILFERNGNGVVTWGPGVARHLLKRDQGFMDFVARGTRPNQPFLTEARQRNAPWFAEAHKWFARTFSTVWPETKPHGIEFSIRDNAEFRSFLQDLLRAGATGIDEIGTTQKQFDDVQIHEDVKEDIRRKLIEKTMFSLVETQYNDRNRNYLVHRADSGELVAEQLTTIRKQGTDSVIFDLDEESDGTRRLIELSAAMWALVKGDRDRVIVIDEIDRSLHPHLLEMLIKLYLNHDEDPSNSQLIITTHQTNILDLELLRKDEIWFAEKRPDGSSDIYSLADFDVRHDKDIRKDYLLGRYGAIPYIGNYAALTDAPEV